VTAARWYSSKACCCSIVASGANFEVKTCRNAGLAVPQPSFAMLISVSPSSMARGSLLLPLK